MTKLKLLSFIFTFILVIKLIESIPRPEDEAPAEDAPAEDAPAEDAPAEDAAADAEKPAEDAPAEDAAPDGEKPAEDAPAEDAPAEDAPAEDAAPDGETTTAAGGDEETTTNAPDGDESTTAAGPEPETAQLTLGPDDTTPANVFTDHYGDGRVIKLFTERWKTHYTVPPTKPGCLCLTRAPISDFKKIGNIHFPHIKITPPRYVTQPTEETTTICPPCPPCECARRSGDDTINILDDLRSMKADDLIGFKK